MIKRFLQRLTSGQKSSALDAARELAIAHKAFEQGDLRHAASHIGNVLVAAPDNAQALTLLNRVADSSNDPLSLVPIQDGNDAGNMVVRAHLLARFSEHQEALDIIMQVAEAVPKAAFVPCAIAWLEADSSLKTDFVMRYLGQAGRRLPEMLADAEIKVATIDHLPRLIEVVIVRQSLETRELAACVSILCRIGRFSEALKVAQEGYSKQPDYFTACGLAFANRHRGNLEESIAAYQKALEYDPSEISVPLDIADLSIELGELEQAIRWYTHILQKDPQHPWALPFYYGAQLLVTGDEQWRARLDDFAKQHPDNRNINNVNVLFNNYTGHVLPSPGDATTNMMRKFMLNMKDSADPKGSLSATISAVEAPSAMIAARGEVARYAPEFKITFTFKEIQKPDPRVPRKKVDYLLWKYSGTVEEPQFSQPNPDVAKEIAAIASSPYSRGAWSQKAKHAADRIGRDKIADVLATMIDPAEAPADVPLWDWMYRNQFASAFVCSRIDEGWLGSLRRSVLLSLANGPVDWTVDAALVALSTIASEDRDARDEIKSLYIELIDRGTHTPGYVCYLSAALMCALDMPDLDPMKRKELIGIVERS